jgi:hypothetical protein
MQKALSCGLLTRLTSQRHLARAGVEGLREGQQALADVAQALDLRMVGDGTSARCCWASPIICAYWRGAGALHLLGADQFLGQLGGAVVLDAHAVLRQHAGRRRHPAAGR